MGRVIEVNRLLWQKTFWDAWEPLPLLEKFTWIFFINNIVALITLIEVLFLR